MTLEALISELEWHKDRAKAASDANIASSKDIRLQAQLKSVYDKEYTLEKYVDDLIFAENREAKGASEWSFYNVLDGLIKKYETS